MLVLWRRKPENLAREASEQRFENQQEPQDIYDARLHYPCSAYMLLVLECFSVKLVSWELFSMKNEEIVKVVAPIP